jgi:hypothetical protein
LSKRSPSTSARSSADQRIALLAHLVEDHTELELLRLVELQFLAGALEQPLAPLRGIFGADLRAAPAVVVLAARGQAADQEGGAEQADEGPLDPDLHEHLLGLRPDWAAVFMVPAEGVRVLSSRFRRVSFLVTARQAAPRSDVWPALRMWMEIRRA